MIKKRILSLLMAMVMMLGMAGHAFAAEYSGTPRASQYLSGYTVILAAKGNGRMSISVSVDGVGVQDKIGVMRIDIDQKVNGVWKYFDTLDAVDHPGFYDYNSRDYMGSTSFYGTPGISYRVSLVVYAERDGGFDTGDITSYTIVCT